MTEEPEPCPFCKSTLTGTMGDGRFLWVYCTDCNAEGPMLMDEDGAVHLWNKALREAKE